MELLVAVDAHIFKTPDGKYWCKTIYGYEFWERYLTVFDSVLVVSRVDNTSDKDIEGFLRVDGLNVKIAELPFMRGMKEYLLNYVKFAKLAKKSISGAQCALIRLPSVTGFMVLKYYRKLKRPYALEVVVDPYDAYASNKIAQFIYTNRLKKEAKRANGVSYVTQFYLQKKYPSYSKLYGLANNYFESYYSTINLKEEYLSIPRNYDTSKKKYTLIHTANNIANDVKGHEVVIKVAKNLRDKQYDVDVVFIGDGYKRKEFEELASHLGISNYVRFTGLISSRKEIRNELLNADIFFFPTKAEGLPRAVIEAMAVGLPCVSTLVNGIPELLKADYLLDPLDVDGFTSLIKRLIDSPKELEEMSLENINKAREYLIDKLTDRRNEFYQKLKKLAIEDRGAYEKASNNYFEK